MWLGYEFDLYGEVGFCCDGEYLLDKWFWCVCVLFDFVGWEMGGD